MEKCSICGKSYEGYGNNAEPIRMQDYENNMNKKIKEPSPIPTTI